MGADVSSAAFFLGGWALGSASDLDSPSSRLRFLSFFSFLSPFSLTSPLASPSSAALAAFFACCQFVTLLATNLLGSAFPRLALLLSLLLGLPLGLLGRVLGDLLHIGNDLLDLGDLDLRCTSLLLPLAPGQQTPTHGLLRGPTRAALLLGFLALVRHGRC
jgi:hypothetical protein